MPLNSKRKGARGEREFRDVLRAAGYCKARRGQQFSGEQGNPDVICPELPEIHWEVKRCQHVKVHDWLEQAWRDAIANRTGPAVLIPVVAHKRNNDRWLATISVKDLLEIIRRSDLPMVSNPSEIKAIECPTPDNPLAVKFIPVNNASPGHDPT